MITLKQEITVQHIRRSEVEDVFIVLDNGHSEYLYFPRSKDMTEEDVLNEYVA